MTVVVAVAENSQINAKAIMCEVLSLLPKFAQKQ